MGTKANPGPFDCYVLARDDEPMFTVIARDPMMPVLVRLWADIQLAGMASGHVPDDQVGRECEKVAEALKVARDAEAWREAHVITNPPQPPSIEDTGAMIEAANRRPKGRRP